MEINLSCNLSLLHKAENSERQKRIVQLTRFFVFVLCAVIAFTVSIPLGITVVGSAFTLIWAQNFDLFDFCIDVFGVVELYNLSFFALFAITLGTAASLGISFSYLFNNEIEPYWSYSYILVPITFYWAFRMVVGLCKDFLDS